MEIPPSPPLFSPIEMNCSALFDNIIPAWRHNEIGPVIWAIPSLLMASFYCLRSQSLHPSSKNKRILLHSQKESFVLSPASEANRTAATFPLPVLMTQSRTALLCGELNLPMEIRGAADL